MTTLYELENIQGMKFSTPEQVQMEKRLSELEIQNQKLEKENEELRKLVEEMSKAYDHHG